MKKMERDYLNRLSVTIRASGVAAAMIVAPVMLGCSAKDSDSVVAFDYPQGYSVAIAPVLNFSGQFDVDPIVTADLLASEFTQFDGITVLPVNRVVAALAAEGKMQVESPSHALRVADAVGADAIVIAGITEYDAFTPVVGLVVQMYAASPETAPGFDVVAASRLPWPTEVDDLANALMPVGQIQRTYNGSHNSVVKSVRRYAKPRSAEDHPYGWRQYLVVQKLYLRFCWHDAIVRLMGQQAQRSVARAQAADSESRT